MGVLLNPPVLEEAGAAKAAAAAAVIDTDANLKDTQALDFTIASNHICMQLRAAPCSSMWPMQLHAVPFTFIHPMRLSAAHAAA
eukprot:364816-Chlamydomonas_euryale.AAC.3